MIQNKILKEANKLFDDFSDSEPDIELINSIHINSNNINKEKINKKNNKSSPIEHDTKFNYKKCSLWPENLINDIGPIEYIDTLKECGGNRGYIATRDIEAGTLLLNENIYKKWPDNKTNKNITSYSPQIFIDTIQNTLKDNNNNNNMFFKYLSQLYPRTIEELPNDLLKKMKPMYINLLKNSQIKEINNNVLQNIFALQCNSFMSGLFLHSAMLNHSCDPNATKFILNKCKNDKNIISQIRAIKDIKKGEEIKISYIYPNFQTYRTRQKLLYDQFGFTCKCEFCCNESIVDNLSELKMDILIDLEFKILLLEEKLMKTNKYHSTEPLLASSLDIMSDILENKFQHDHFILIRIHKLIGNCCAILLRRNKQKLNNNAFQDHLVLYLRSAFELLELQLKYLSSNHIDLIQTYDDLSQGLQLLLSSEAFYYSDTKQNNSLLGKNLEWKTIREASFAEAKYSSEFQRLKKLYE